METPVSENKATIKATLLLTKENHESEYGFYRVYIQRVTLVTTPAISFLSLLVFSKKGLTTAVRI